MIWTVRADITRELTMGEVELGQRVTRTAIGVAPAAIVSRLEIAMVLGLVFAVVGVLPAPIVLWVVALGVGAAKLGIIVLAVAVFRAVVVSAVIVVPF